MGRSVMPNPNPARKFAYADPPYIGQAKKHYDREEVCHETYKSVPKPAEGVAAPLEPSADLNATMRRALISGYTSPYFESLVVSAVKVAQDHAAAVSKNLQEEHDELVVQVNELDDDLDVARDRISDLLNHDGGPGSIDYDAAKVFRARAKLLEFREITALRETK
jgi:hypothetical protein